MHLMIVFTASKNVAVSRVKLKTLETAQHMATSSFLGIPLKNPCNFWKAGLGTIDSKCKEKRIPLFPTKIMGRKAARIWDEVSVNLQMLVEVGIIPLKYRPCICP